MAAPAVSLNIRACMGGTLLATRVARQGDVCNGEMKGRGRAHSGAFGAHVTGARPDVIWITHAWVS
ncbi:hypothetical protein GCM10022245_77130 [Streptomyces mayteni]